MYQDNQTIHNHLTNHEGKGKQDIMSAQQIIDGLYFPESHPSMCASCTHKCVNAVNQDQIILKIESLTGFSFIQNNRYFLTYRKNFYSLEIHSPNINKPIKQGVIQSQ